MGSRITGRSLRFLRLVPPYMVRTEGRTTVSYEGKGLAEHHGPQTRHALDIASGSLMPLRGGVDTEAE